MQLPVNLSGFWTRDEVSILCGGTVSHQAGVVQGAGAPQSCPTLVHEEDEAVVYLGLSEPLDLSVGR